MRITHFTIAQSGYRCVYPQYLVGYVRVSIAGLFDTIYYFEGVFGYGHVFSNFATLFLAPPILDRLLHPRFLEPQIIRQTKWLQRAKQIEAGILARLLYASRIIQSPAELLLLTTRQATFRREWRHVRVQADWEARRSHERPCKRESTSLQPIRRLWRRLAPG
jgi:hypothetical protein